MRGWFVGWLVTGVETIDIRKLAMLRSILLADGTARTADSHMVFLLDPHTGDTHYDFPPSQMVVAVLCRSLLVAWIVRRLRG